MKVSCSSDGLSIQFNNPDASDPAKKQWLSLGHDFFLVSYSDACERENVRRRTYCDVTSLSFDATKYVVDVECFEVGMENAFHDLDISWGSYQPNEGESAVQKGQTPSQTVEPHHQITLAPSSAPNLELGKRSQWDILHKIASKGKSVFSDAASGVASAANKANNPSGSKTKSASWSAQPTDLSRSPWGQQKELLNVAGVGLYCVDCETHGNVVTTGDVSFSILPPKVKASTLSVSGNLEANLGMGFKVDITEPIPLPDMSIELYNQGLPALTIPDIITIGPQITFNASAGLEVSGEGELMVGGNLAIDHLSATLDLVKKGPSNARMNSKFTPKHAFTGSLTLTATVGLPVALGFGFTFPRVPELDKFDVNLVNTPTFHASTNVSNTGACKDGVGINVGFDDDTSVDVFGIYTKQLYDYKPHTDPFWQICISEKPTPTPTPESKPKPTHRSKPTPTPKSKSTPSPHHPSRTPGRSKSTPIIQHPGSNTPTASPENGEKGPPPTTSRPFHASSRLPQTSSEHDSSHGVSKTDAHGTSTPTPVKRAVYNYPM